MTKTLDVKVSSGNFFKRHTQKPKGKSLSTMGAGPLLRGGGLQKKILQKETTAEQPVEHIDTNITTDTEITKAPAKNIKTANTTDTKSTPPIKTTTDTLNTTKQEKKPDKKSTIDTKTTTAWSDTKTTTLKIDNINENRQKGGGNTISTTDTVLTTPYLAKINEDTIVDYNNEINEGSDLPSKINDKTQSAKSSTDTGITTTGNPRGGNQSSTDTLSTTDTPCTRDTVLTTGGVFQKQQSIVPDTHLTTAVSTTDTFATTVSDTGFTMVPHYILQGLSRLKSKNEQAVLLTILRHTVGFHRDTCSLSLNDFSRYSGLDRSNLNKAIKRLVDFNILYVVSKGRHLNNLSSFRFDPFPLVIDSSEKKNGFTKMPNNILRHLSSLRSKNEISCLLCAIRFSLGFQTESFSLSNRFISKWTGIHQPHVNKSMKSLVEKRLVSISRLGNSSRVETSYILNLHSFDTKLTTDALPTTDTVRTTNLGSNSYLNSSINRIDSVVENVSNKEIKDIKKTYNHSELVCVVLDFYKRAGDTNPAKRKISAALSDIQDLLLNHSLVEIKKTIDWLFVNKPDTLHFSRVSHFVSAVNKQVTEYPVQYFENKKSDCEVISNNEFDKLDSVFESLNSEQRNLLLDKTDDSLKSDGLLEFAKMNTKIRKAKLFEIMRKEGLL